MNKQYVIERLKEPSTWRGFVYILAAFGIPIAPELAKEITAAGMGIAGIIAILTSDKR